MNLDQFLALYRQRDSVWWTVECGWHQNFFDELLDRYDDVTDHLLALQDG